MEVKNNNENDKLTNLICNIFILIVCSILIFSAYHSSRYKYYINDELSILEHDKLKEKIYVINIDTKYFNRKTDFWGKLCFKYKYLKNNKNSSLIRIDKFKHKAIYLIPEDKKYYISPNDPLGILTP